MLLQKSVDKKCPCLMSFWQPWDPELVGTCALELFGLFFGDFT